MLLVEPVVIRPLLAEWAAEKTEIAAELERAEAAKASATRTKRRNEAGRRYRTFLNRLRGFTVLDPACGSGNFLYLALQALKDLEHRVQLEAEADLGFQRAFPEVGPANVKGIEINPYAVELARVSVWIGEIQWMRRNGFAEARDPVLKPPNNPDPTGSRRSAPPAVSILTAEDRRSAGCCPRWTGTPASTRPAPTAYCACGAPVGPRRPQPRSSSRTAATCTAAAAGNRCGASSAATNPTRRRDCSRSAAAPGPLRAPAERHARPSQFAALFVSGQQPAARQRDPAAAGASAATTTNLQPHDNTRGKTDDRATKAYAAAGGPRHVMRKEQGMAWEREVVVGRVGRVLRTPGPGQAGSRGGEDRTRPAAAGDAGTAAGGAGEETLNPARLHEGSGGPGAYSASAARPGEAVGSWSSWPPGLLADLEASFSPERMSRYVAAAAGDRERAVELYAWNTVVSGAFYEPLQGLEIALRNALHGQLTRCYGEAWYDNPEAGLDIGTLERIAEARTALARVGQVPTPSRVVADLAFGFWVALLRVGRRLDLAGHRADYERTLWRPALRRAFPHRAKLTRMAAHQALDPLRKLRNQIAHHKPIFARRLDEDHTRILEVTGWISLEARAWIERRSRVPLLLDASAVAVEDMAR